MQAYHGKKRSESAFYNAYLWWCLVDPELQRDLVLQFPTPNRDELLKELERQIRKSIETTDVTFFEDFAYFLEFPLRKYSLRKLWLVGIHIGIDSIEKEDGEHIEGVPLTGFHQRRRFRRDAIARMWAETDPTGNEQYDESQISRDCAELGIELIDSRKRTKKKK